MTELAVRTGTTGSSLAITSEQDGFTPKQVAALKQLGVEDATQGDLDVFFHQVQRTGLDPFVRQIYMVGRKSKNQRTNQWETKYTIQTGIDGFRLIGRRAADRAGETLEVTDTEWCGKDGIWHDVWLKDEPPAAARVSVIRNGGRFPGLALFHEYAQITREGGLTKMWAEKGALMIAKCAEALAWRRAYPQDLSGIYTGDEMAKANQQERPRVEQVKPTSIREAIGAPTVRTDAQSKKLAILLRELGMNDRAEALSYISGVVGRDVESTKTLTVAEASGLIDHLQKMQDESINPTTGEVVEAELVEEPTDEWPEVRQPGGSAA